MLTAGNAYFEKAIATILKVQQTQAEALDKASEWIKNSLEKGGVLHVFGSGHNALGNGRRDFRELPGHQPLDKGSGENLPWSFLTP